MRNRLFVATLLSGAFALAVAAVPGCNCAHNSGRNGDGGDNDAGIPAIGSITIDPPDTTLDLVQGQPAPTQTFTVTYHASSGDQDVTGAAMYALTDPTMGTMTLNTFTAGTDHGGTTQLMATYSPDGSQQQTALATIHIRVHGTFPGPDCMGNCPQFPPDGAPTCAGTNITPNIVYPADGVLLPPNMSVVSVQWTPWPGSPPTIKEFEVDFENANTDVRVTTLCATQTKDTTGALSGGCDLELDPAMWDFIAKSNRGGDPVKVTVRATTDGTCATPSQNSINMAFAEEDLNGGIFYWKSTITAGGVGGEIWAKQFGSMINEEQITGVAGTNLAAATCFGCHALSRDGKQMIANFDDADSDDEYADVGHTLIDVMSKSSLDSFHTYQTRRQPGFQTFNPDHSLYLATNGLGTNPTNILYLFDTSTPDMFTTLNFGPTNSRPTMLDWSPDGTSLLYVLPAKVATWDNMQRNDDDHVFGGSIYAAPWDPAAKMLGTPTPIVMSQGENNYYPSYSPDGAFIAFNRVPMQTVTNPIATNPDCTGSGAQVLCPNDSFSNPKARVWLLSTKAGSMPVDAENLNGSTAASPVDVSNSWPRWSPFIQMYKGQRLLWITFSSTRDYGLLVRNHQTGMFQCYPADSLQQPGALHNQPFPAGCEQPQIWMAAINLSHLEFNGTDPSFTAFWLPFQDMKTHNHTAQWTQTVVTQPQPDMGMCIPAGGDCSAMPNNCCNGLTCDTTTMRCGGIP